MSLHIELIGGKLSVNLWSVLEEFTGAERAALIDALACQTEIIDEVMNQVIDGWTSEGSRGGKGGSIYHTTYHGIDHAVRRIAKASGEISANEIARLEAALIDAEKRQQVGWDAYHELLRSRT